ncbi:MAG: hypothetical protein HC906_01155 [Bacteroidales bacterium]|nr:hypothetical protein [Bacteroidales bacterium]
MSHIEYIVTLLNSVEKKKSRINRFTEKARHFMNWSKRIMIFVTKIQPYLINTGVGINFRTIQPMA